MKKEWNDYNVINLGDPSKFVWGHYSLWLIHASYLSVWFAVTTSSCISLSKTANESLLIYQTALGHQVATDCQFYHQAEAMMKQLTKPQLMMTSWRYYDVDKSMILSSVSAIFTYLILLLEINPSVKAKLQGKEYPLTLNNSGYH